MNKYKKYFQQLLNMEYIRYAEHEIEEENEINAINECSNRH